MKLRALKITATLLTLGFFASTWASSAHALEPKLLWTKKLDFEITGLVFAKISGDVIVGGKYARRIIVFDKEGNVSFEWGLRIDRQPMGVGISDDGEKIIYSSSWVEAFKNKMNKPDWDQRVHYMDSSGKELWNEKIPYMGFSISPDGSTVVGTGGPGVSSGIKVYDASGEFLHSIASKAVTNLVFSPDSSYMAATDTSRHTYLFTKQGEVWKKDLGNHAYAVTSMSFDGNYMAYSTFMTIEGGVKIVDKTGDVLFVGNNISIVSGDGSKGVLFDDNGLRVYSLPDSALLKSYPIIPVDDKTDNMPISVSYDGRFVVAKGKKIGGQNRSNLFVVDLTSDTSWETSIAEEFVQTHVTADGKYLLIRTGMPVPGSVGTLRYYQVY